jgi:hypothetical protein
MSQRERKRLLELEATEKRRSQAVRAIVLEERQRIERIKYRFALIRQTYGDLLTTDVRGIDFGVPAKQYLLEIVQRQIQDLPDLSDEALLNLWLRFARFYSAQRPQERPKRDWMLHEALGAEWDRRMLYRPGGAAGFKWPSTAAPNGDASLGGIWPPKGMLDALGYAVGRTHGLGSPERRRILDHLFLQRLPVVVSGAYTEEWAAPGTPARLQKLAVTLAALARNAKRNRSRDYRQAIEEWEADLEYLHAAYYVGRFGFAWPTLR